MPRSVLVDQVLAFRIHSEDLFELKLRAQQERCSPSAFVREAVLDRLRDEREDRRPGARRPRGR